MRRFVLLLATVLVAPSVRAQSLDIQHGRMTPGTTGLTIVQGARTENPRTWRLGLDLQYLLRPLAISNNDQIVSPIVSDQLGLHLRAAWAITDGIDFGASLAIVPFEHISAQWHEGAFLRTSRDVAGIGDLYLQARFQVARQERVAVDVALVPVLYVPTFTSNFISEGGFVFAPEVDIGRHWGAFQLAVNLGLALRKDDVVDGLDKGQQFSWRAGVGYGLGRFGLSERSQVTLEAFGLMPLGQVSDAVVPAEWLVSGRYAWPSWLATVGVGTALSRGYGAPLLRILASVTWAPEGQVPKTAVAAVNPDAPDADQDGIPDAKDACPQEREVVNGYQDEDGCPDVSDKDGDGIIDEKDQCPNTAEDVDGFEDDDGCPDPDNDQDSFPDKLDKCPDQAEDLDGVEDDDGCPELDADDDGIPDAKDKCPTKAEVINGTEDDDGCPDEGGEQLVELKGATVELKGTVFFGVGSDVLLKRSFGQLNQLTALLKNHAEMRILVEGYADADGNAAANMRLSKRRADSVRKFLMAHGIEADRIKTEGFGENRPRAANTDGRSRALNRRVTISVLKDDAHPAPGKGPVPPSLPAPPAPAPSGLSGAPETPAGKPHGE